MRNTLAILVICGLLVVTGAPAYAFNGYLTSATTKYPAISSSKLNSCLLCHTTATDINAQNPYGNAYGVGHDFDAIAGADSDGDGFTNLQEITALTYPGDATDKPNAAPVAANQSVSTPKDTAKAITLAATDADTGDTLTYSIVAQPGHGTLSGTPPAVTYAPAAGYTGADSFTFKANDGKIDSNVATVSITVTAPANAVPVAANQSVSTGEGVAKAITLAATDADGDTLTYSIIAQPGHGALSGTPPAVTYTPAAAYTGADSFTFKANDGKADSNVATVSITVTGAANTPPVAANQTVSTAKDTVKAITLAATDADGDTLTFSIVAQPGHGALSGTPPAMTYTPASSYTGDDSFTFKANDGEADSNVATVSISITAVANTPPVASNQSVTTAKDAAKTITLEAADAEGDTLTYSVVAEPGHGALSGTAPAVTYTPAAGYTGDDSFTFKANDGTADSNVATVSITVTAPANVTVPDVVNATEATARAQLVALGLAVTTTQQHSSTVPSGKVISQNPAAGSEVAPGASVALVVSTGPAPQPGVPNVVGKTQAQATAAITGAGLMLGTVTEAASDIVPEGRVISQSPAAGSQVASGSAVALLVSSGQETIVCGGEGEGEGEGEPGFGCFNDLLGGAKSGGLLDRAKVWLDRVLGLE